MNASDALDKLIPALVKARSGFAAIRKDKTVQITAGRSYKYADLGSIIDAVMPALSENGFALVQPMIFRDGVLLLETRLIHTSGQWLGSEYPVPMASKAQELGSHITYGKKYSITSLLGLVGDDDDDGAAASQDKPKRESKPAAVPTPPNVPTAPVGAQGTIPDGITQQQRSELRDAARVVFGTGYVAEIKRLMLELVGKDDSSRLDQSELTLVKRALQNYADKMAEEGK